MISLKTQNWQINDIETVFFDKDGTLIDLHYFWGKMTELRADKIIEKYNLSPTLSTQLCLHLGYDNYKGKMLKDGITALYSRSKIIEIFKSDLLKYDVKTTNEALADIFDDVSNLFYENMFEYTKPIKSAINFVQKLHQKGIKLGIITSDSIESTMRTIKYFGWEDLFCTVVGRESSTETKESGALTKIALKESESTPESSILIGDAPMDYLAATNAGIKNAILVATGQLNTSALQKTSNFVVKSLDSVTIL